MNFREKVLLWDQIPAWREGLRGKGVRLVVTNGCFDLLHLGHASYLEAAAAEGDLLLVGINSDASVRQLKGPTRPLNSQNDRALVVAALESVGAVCIFEDVRATRFLAQSRPDVYVKGGDYTLETLEPTERSAVEDSGGRIVLLPLVPGKSTTAIIQRM